MLLHTLELSYILSGLQYSSINKDFKKTENSKWYFMESGLYLRLESYGIRIRLLKRLINKNSHYINSRDGFCFYLYYIISPARFFQNGNYEVLFDANDLHDSCDCINRMIRSVSKSLPCVESCSLKRIDFCSNIIMDSHEQVIDAISLINRSCYSARFHQKFEIKDGRRRYSNTEATFSRKNYVEISVYDKKHQLEEANRYSIKYHKTDLNILRCEIRCDRIYINYLKNKFKIKETDEFFLKAAMIGEYVFKSQLKITMLDCDFMKLSDIKEKITQMHLHERTSNELYSFLNETAMHRSVIPVCISYGENKVKAITKRLRSINSALIPMPVNSSLPEGFNLLNKSFEYMDKQKL